MLFICRSCSHFKFQEKASSSVFSEDPLTCVERVRQCLGQTKRTRFLKKNYSASASEIMVSYSKGHARHSNGHPTMLVFSRRFDEYRPDENRGLLAVAQVKDRVVTLNEIAYHLRQNR